MASEAGDSEALEGASHGPRECMPCRGTGRVISHLGGAESTVTCPWCAGAGVRPPEVDAQARWLEDRASAGVQGAEGSPPAASAPGES